MSSRTLTFYMCLLFCLGCSVNPLYDHDFQAENSDYIDIDVIAERDGQILRGYLLNSFRDLHFLKQKYRLTITLSSVEKSFVLANDGNARRARICHTANVILKNNRREIIFQKSISVYGSSDISTARGEVVLSLYGRNSSVLLKELGARIVENIKVFLSNEN